MSKKEYILTIAIPTYNRADLLPRTLDSVFEQWNDMVEVIVSDNCSTDNTRQVVLEYKKKYNIKYYRNSKNGGMDVNFLNCIDKANGEYVQLLSDDDILLPGTIDKTIEIINQYQPTYLHLNSHFYNEKNFVKKANLKPTIFLKEDFISSDKNEIIDNLGIYITFLSSAVIKKSEYDKITFPKKFYNTHLLHAHIIYSVLEGSDKTVYITKSVHVLAKGNNSGGYNLYEVWVKQYKKLLLITAVKNGFSEKRMKKQYVDDVNGLIRGFILNFRMSNTKYDMQNRKILLQNTWKYPLVWMKTYFVAFGPKKLVKYFCQ